MFNDVTKFGTDYQENLEFGLGAEERLGWFVRDMGYDFWNTDWAINKNSGKGPKIYTADRKEIAMPDLCFANDEEKFFVDCKAKTGLTLYRKTGKFQTGIDVKSFWHYMYVQNRFKDEVRIIHVSAGRPTVDTPATVPGIFMASMNNLVKTVDHEIYGMMYWDIDIFQRIGTPSDAYKILFGITVDLEFNRHFPNPNDPFEEHEWTWRDLI